MSGQLPEPTVIRKTLQSVVQIVALRQKFMGSYAPAWTGSGTIVDKRGIILTNCHVANPRAMGMSSPPADALAIAITERSDEPPAVTYIAEIVAQSPELDIAVLKITQDIKGKKVRNLNLPYINVGDSDKLELADVLAIFGFPGIGGETVTFTSGNVAGFNKQKVTGNKRAWIKTDATIAGGNSGGTAINLAGELVGIPTQAAAGTGITPVDARPVVDTNQDGRVDDRDTPMAVGGFINGLRPVNLAKPLLKQAGVKVTGGGARSEVPTTPPPKPAQSAETKPAAKPSSSTVQFSNLVFSTNVTRDGRPINPTDRIPTGQKNLFATVDFQGMRKGTAWRQVWALNGDTIMDKSAKWEDASRGRKVLAISNSKGLPEGTYHVVVTVRNGIVSEGQVVVGKAVDDSDTEVKGRVVDEKGRGIKDSLVIALKPGVSVRDFVRVQDRTMAFTSTRTDAQGRFLFPQQLPKGQAYGLVVVAKGYRDLVVEGAIRVGTTAPEQAEMSPIQLQRE